MKTIKTRLFFTGILTIASMAFSCDTEEAVAIGCDVVWTNEVASELSILNEAAVALQNEPSFANCESFRVASIDYVEAMEAVRNCVLGAQREAFDQALDQAKADLNLNDCSALQG